MNEMILLENPLLNELYEMPWKFRRDSKGLIARLERETGVGAEAAFLEYYRLRCQDMGQALRVIEMDDDMSVETVVKNALRSFPSYQCLTDAAPAAHAKRSMRRFRTGPVELCRIAGDLAISLNFDVPVVTKKQPGGSRGIVQRISSPLYPVLNIRGGQNILDVNQINVDRIYYLNDHFGGNNYAHWLLDWVPRLKFLVEDKSLANHSLVFGMQLNSSQRETLQALGIDTSRIVAIRKATLNSTVTFCASELVGCSTSGAGLRRPAQACSPWALDFVRGLFLNGLERGARRRRLLISRKGTRQLLLSQETRTLLDSMDFEEVLLEGIPVSEQARLFAESEIVISAHGAALSNLVFCERGTKVLEIFPENYSTSNFFALSSAMELDYFCAVGTSVKSPLGDHLRDFDVEVDHDVVKRFLG